MIDKLIFTPFSGDYCAFVQILLCHNSFSHSSFVASLLKLPCQHVQSSFECRESQQGQSKHNGHTVGPYLARTDWRSTMFLDRNNNLFVSTQAFYTRLSLPLLLYSSVVLHSASSPAGWPRSASTFRGCLHASLK